MHRRITGRVLRGRVHKEPRPGAKSPPRLANPGEYGIQASTMAVVDGSRAAWVGHN